MDLADHEYWDITNKVKGVEVSRKLALKPYVPLADKLDGPRLDTLPIYTVYEMVREMAQALDWFEQNWGSPIARAAKSSVYRKTKKEKQ